MKTIFLIDDISKLHAGLKMDWYDKQGELFIYGIDNEITYKVNLKDYSYLKMIDSITDSNIALYHEVEQLIEQYLLIPIEDR